MQHFFADPSSNVKRFRNKMIIIVETVTSEQKLIKNIFKAILKSYIIKI